MSKMKKNPHAKKQEMENLSINSSSPLLNVADVQRQLSWILQCKKCHVGISLGIEKFWC